MAEAPSAAENESGLMHDNAHSDDTDQDERDSNSRSCITMLRSAFEANDSKLLDEIIEDMVSKSVVVGLRKIHTAAGYGFADLVEKYLVEGKENPNCECSFNDLSSITPLHFCSGIGPDPIAPDRAKCIELLVKHGADVNHVTSRLDTPLHWATKLADIKVCEALVKANADVNKLNIDNCTCAHGAAFYKNIEILELLMNSKLDVNIADISGKNILHLLCKDSYNEDYDTRLNEEDSGRNNPEPIQQQPKENTVKSLEEIFEYKKRKQENLIRIVARLLEEFKMDVNAKDQAEFTPLMYACEHTNIDLVKKLLAHNANINECNSEGISCLLLGILNSSPQVVEFLIKNGFNLKNTDENISYITDAAYLNDPDILQLLLTAGCDLNETKQDENGVILNPLWAACERSNQAIVELLLSKGANTIIRPDLNMTALHCNAMAQSENVAITKLLCEHNCPINVRTTSAGETPLFLATNSGFYEIIEYLLDKGVDPNDCSPPTRTCFQQAVFRGHKDIILLLLNKGYKLTEEDKTDLNLFIMDLYQDNDVDMINYLISNGLTDKEKVLDCIKRVHEWQKQEEQERLVRVVEEADKAASESAEEGATTKENDLVEPSVATLNDLTLNLNLNQPPSNYFPTNLEELEVYLQPTSNPANFSDDEHDVE